MICFKKSAACDQAVPCHPNDGCVSAPGGCQATHPTATDVVPRMVKRGASMVPARGPGGNVIDRYPLRCWHGDGHEGRHGYGAITWAESRPPVPTGGESE